MKTSDFNINLTSQQLKENISKQFGMKVNLEKYNREQLEDMRNKLRTRVFQQEGRAGINDLLTNETYQKDKAMLELLNTRIKEMLGEDIKKLKDKLQMLEENKKGVKAVKHPKGSKGSGDGNLANNYPPFDKVTRGDVVAGALGKDQKGSKAKKEEGVEENRVVKGRAYGGSAQKDTDHNHAETPSTASSEKSSAERARDKAMDRASDQAGKDWEARGYKRTVVKGKAQSGSPRDDKELEEGTSDEAKQKMTSFTTQAAADKAYKAAEEEYGAKNVQWGAKNKLGIKTILIRTANKSVKEAAKSCNHTAEGKMCPVHKMAECPMEEGMKMVKSPKGKMVPADGNGKKDLKKSKMDETNSIFRRHVKIVNESLGYLLQEDEEEKAAAITAASDMANDFTSWMQRVGQYQTKVMIELSDEIRHNFGPAEAEAFKQAVSPALAATLETLTSQRELISSAIAQLAGGQVPQPMGTEPAPEMPEAPAPEPAAPDTMNEPTGDEFGASDAAAGAGTPGRELRENQFARKLAESHSIISKLAK